MKSLVSIGLIFLAATVVARESLNHPVTVNFWDQPRYGGRAQTLALCRKAMGRAALGLRLRRADAFGSGRGRDGCGRDGARPSHVGRLVLPKTASAERPAPVVVFCSDDKSVAIPSDLLARRGYAVVRASADAEGLSRAVEAALKDPAVDARRLFVCADAPSSEVALWLAGCDERVTGTFIAALPSVAHMLKLMSPRMLYVASAVGTDATERVPPAAAVVQDAAGLWERAYQLTGRVGFHARTGDRLTAADWTRFLDFADRPFGKPATAADAPKETPSPFTVAVSSEPKLPVVNYAKNGGYERGFKDYIFGPDGYGYFTITNEAYEGECALWCVKGRASSINTPAAAPPGTTNRVALTVKLGPEHKGLSGLGAGLSQARYAGPSTGGKVKPFAAASVDVKWQQSGSYAGWQRIESEPFVVPADATNVVMNLHAGSEMYCAAGGLVDNLFCGPAWTELSFAVENEAGLAQVTVEDENGERVFCADAFPPDVRSYERKIRVSAAMRYCVKAVDRQARSVAKWYPSPRPEVAAVRAPLAVRGLRRLWPSNVKAAVFKAEMRGKGDLAGASLVAVVTATNGVEVLRKTVSPVLVETRIEIPLAELAQGGPRSVAAEAHTDAQGGPSSVAAEAHTDATERVPPVSVEQYQLVVSYRDAKGATVAAEAPVDFWKFPARTTRPRDVYTIRNHTLFRNGKFFFPIFSVGGFPGWDVLRNHRFDKEAYLKWARDVIADEKACGFNVMQTSAWYFPDLARRGAAEPLCQKYFPSWMPYNQAAQIPLDFLDIARMYDEAGLAIIPYLHIGRPDRADYVSAWLEAVVKYRAADNILCWHLSDELDAAIAHNLMLNDLHHEADPDRLTWINFINGARNNRTAGDILSEDPYPVPKERLAKVVWHAETVRGCTRPDQGVFQWLQMFGGEGAWTRSPTIAELEAMVYMSLNHGVRGLAYFGYTYLRTDRDGIRSMTEADYAKLGAMNARVLERAPVFCLGEELARGYDSKVHFDMAVFRHEGAVWVSVVNGLDEARTLDIPLPEGVPSAGKADVVDENRTVSFGEAMIKDDFAPYAVRLYRIRL